MSLSAFLLYSVLDLLLSVRLAPGVTAAEIGKEA